MNKIDFPHPGSVGVLYVTVKPLQLLGMQPSHWAGRVPWTSFLATVGGTVVPMV